MTNETVNQMQETDAEISVRLKESFETLDIMTLATAQGINRSLIASGSPGVGKSFGVESVLNSLPSRLSFSAVSGNIKATGLYKLLYKNRAKGTVTLIDDADSAFSDENSLNIIKKATDTSEIRTISWSTETVFSDENGEDIPSSYVYEGTIIILTNVDLAAVAESGSKISEHVGALITRSAYIDLGFHDNRSKFLRVKQIVQDGMLSKLGIGYTEELDILYYMESNLDNLREISLRTAIKLANLYRISNTDWRKLAKNTCLKSNLTKAANV